MRTLNHLFIFCVLVFCTKCSGQTRAAGEAQKLASQIEEKTNVPGESPNANLYMKAVIDGKPWVADKLLPDASIGSNQYRVTGSANGTTIGFYVYIPHIKVGDISEFGEGKAADFITDDENSFYAGRAGKFRVIKVDNDGFEVNFYFTANTESGSAKKYEVTDGNLRFPWARKK